MFLSSLEFRKDFRINVKGIGLFSNTFDRLIACLMWKYSLLEATEIHLIKKTIKEGMTIIDIGANIGYYTLMMGKLVERNGVVYAFEPEQNNYRLLKKNIQINRAKNIFAIRKAVSDNISEGRIYINKWNRGDHRIYDSGDNRLSMPVETLTLDQFMEDKGRVDFIKLDIQGAEYSALVGMERTIDKNENLILVAEFSPYHLKKTGISSVTFLSWIESRGFIIYLIDKKKREFRSVCKKELLELCKGKRYENLWLSKIDFSLKNF